MILEMANGSGGSLDMPWNVQGTCLAQHTAGARAMLEPVCSGMTRAWRAMLGTCRAHHDMPKYIYIFKKTSRWVKKEGFFAFFLHKTPQRL